MNITQQIIILSAERSENSFERNRQLTENLASCLDELQLTYNRATGVYNGSEENSFVVIVKNEDEISTLKDLALKPVGFGGFGQDAVLYQDANQQAYLLDKNGGVLNLGRLEQVNAKEIERLENYTVLNGKVYTTIKR